MRNFLHCGFRQKSFFLILNGSSFLIRRTTAKTTLIAWAKNSCNRGTGCVHVETCNKYQVTENIYDACDKYKKQRGLAVSKSTENRRKQVVSDDKKDSTSADTDVNSSQFYSFCRSLHQDRDWMRETNHDDEQSN